MHSCGRVTTTTIHLQNSFIFPNWNSAPTKNNSSFPLLPTPVTSTLLSVFVYWTIPKTSYEWNHGQIWFVLYLILFLIILGIMLSGLIRVVACVRISFLFKAEWCSIVETYHTFVHLAIDRHLSCFYLFAIVNHASLNMGVQVSLWVLPFISLGSVPQSKVGSASLAHSSWAWEIPLLWALPPTPGQSVTLLGTRAQTHEKVQPIGPSLEDLHLKDWWEEGSRVQDWF